MKFIIIKSHLKDALSLLQKSWSENTNLPILKNVLIDASDGKIQLTATNLEIATRVTVPGKILQDGSVTIPLGLFSSVISSLQTERLNIEQKKDGVYIKTDNYEATIQGIPFSEFPIIPKIKNEEEYIEIKGAILKEAVGQVVVATQPSDIRPELSSIFLDFSLESIKLAATDSFRLAEKTISSNQYTATFTDGFLSLIPIKTAHELLRIIKDTSLVRIFHDPHQVLFLTEDTYFISRLLEGTFPDYSSVVPKKFSAEMVAKKDEFLDALRLTGMFGSKAGEIRLKIVPGKKVAEVFSGDQVLGENTYLLPAEIKGKSVDVGFNWHYVGEGIKAVQSPDVYFAMNAEENKAFIQGKGDGSYFYIVASLMKS